MSEVDSAEESRPVEDAPPQALPGRPGVPAPAAAERRSPDLGAPALRASWFLRATAVVSVLGTILGVIVLPGAKGIAGDAVVGIVSRVAWSFGYMMLGLSCVACVLACFELSRAERMSVAPRVIAIGATGAVLAFAAPALVIHLPTPVTLAMSCGTVVVVFAAASVTLRVQRTRAVGLIALALGTAGMLRFFAWQVATFAGDHANTRMYAVGQGMATAAVALEGLGQLIAAAWLGTRSRVTGQGLSSAAVGAAFVLTWGAAHGGGPTAPAWQAGLHTALAGAPGLPPPFALGALATFLVSASMLLALASALQSRQVVAVVCALSLTLLGRGAFDVPLRALPATAAALWLMVALVDDRAMWKSLIQQREQRLEEERLARGA